MFPKLILDMVNHSNRINYLEGAVKILEDKIEMLKSKNEFDKTMSMLGKDFSIPKKTITPVEIGFASSYPFVFDEAMQKKLLEEMTQISIKLQEWLLNTEEQIIIDTIAKHGSKEALLRLRKAIDAALKK